ncbi:MAG TPA: hypothetical protein VMB21_17000 [Candidatus Limnocylindria bacterium]|nr:hypothetical protein [Candidatus Limnocylindria bacterium]
MASIFFITVMYDVAVRSGCGLHHPAENECPATALPPIETEVSERAGKMGASPGLAVKGMARAEGRGQDEPVVAPKLPGTALTQTRLKKSVAREN